MSKALRARSTALTLALAATLAVAASGCGDDDPEPTVASGPPPLSSLEEPPPPDASPLLENVYRQFQPPRADPSVEGAPRALRNGERVCRGQTPRQIRERFIEESELSEDQASAVQELPRHEGNPSPNFVAGQLAALVYEKTLPADAVATYGFQGCIYALSLRLKRELAGGGGN